jgi:spore maturation protein CgeB
MKVLILAGEGAIQRVRISYANAMGHIGFQCIVWHPNSGKPAFDIFDEFEPEVVMCGTWEIDRAVLKNLMKRPHIKVILWGSNWGRMDRYIQKIDPVLMTSEEEKERIRLLKENNNIDKVFSYYHQVWAGMTHNYWQEIGLTPVGLPLAADLITYKPADVLPGLKCDLSFIGGYWPYKAINLDRFLLPLCYPEEKLKVKIFGWGNWPVVQHLGELDEPVVGNLFASSTVNANVFEPLAQKYGFDVNERCYKILASGGFCVSEYCDSAANDIFTGNEVVFTKTPQEFKEQVKFFVAHPDERLPYIERGLSAVRKTHNYFLRLRELMLKVGLNNEKLVTNLNEVIAEL